VAPKIESKSLVGPTPCIFSNTSSFNLVVCQNKLSSPLVKGLEHAV